jgi:alkaline phosphatase
VDLKHDRLSRRDSLKLGGISVAAAAAALTGMQPSRAAAQQVSGGGGGEGRRPKNIIFMVSDGMSAGTLTLAESFCRIVRGPEHRTHWDRLMRRRDASHGLQETYSLNSLVTDSAAASTAWGSGSRIHNGPLNVLPDGTHLTPIADLVKGSGRRVALVTSTTITHATPAGFAAVQGSRGQEAEIAPQYLGKVDVLMGGGRNRFEAGHREDEHDLLGAYRQQGYTYWDRREQVVAGEQVPRVLGLFTDSGHLPYVIDRRASEALQAQIPTLAEMTRAALASLADAGEGFLMQVEGGRVDHAAHASDAAALMWEQLDFDDALGVVLEYAERRGDTLVVVTSDHGNSNPALNSMGGRTNEAFESLARCTASFGELRRLMLEAAGEEGPTADIIADVIQTHCEIAIAPEHAAVLAATFEEANPHELNPQLGRFPGALSQVLGHHTGIQFTGNSHTADYVVCTAFGPGQERFAGLQPNTASFQHMTQLFGIEHENPSMSPDEAWRQAARRAVDPAVLSHV